RASSGGGQKRPRPEDGPVGVAQKEQTAKPSRPFAAVSIEPLPQKPCHQTDGTTLSLCGWAGEGQRNAPVGAGSPPGPWEGSAAWVAGLADRSRARRTTRVKQVKECSGNLTIGGARGRAGRRHRPGSCTRSRCGCAGSASAARGAAREQEQRHVGWVRPS